MRSVAIAEAVFFALWRFAESKPSYGLTVINSKEYDAWNRVVHILSELSCVDDGDKVAAARFEHGLHAIHCLMEDWTSNQKNKIDALKTALRALETFFEINSDITMHASQVLHVMTDKSDSKTIDKFRALGGFQTVVKVLRHYRTSNLTYEIIRPLFLVIIHSREINGQNSRLLGDCGACEAVVLALEQGDWSAAQEGCLALSSLVRTNPANKSLAVKTLNAVQIVKRFESCEEGKECLRLLQL